MMGRLEEAYCRCSTRRVDFSASRSTSTPETKERKEKILSRPWYRWTRVPSINNDLPTGHVAWATTTI
jgi:hypothetical protein